MSSRLPQRLFRRLAALAGVGLLFSTVAAPGGHAQRSGAAGKRREPQRAAPAAAARARSSSPAVSGAAAVAAHVSAAQLKDYLYFIAADELEGRDTPSRGLDTAAKFLATNLSRWGLRPAGDDGTFFQKIPLSRTTIVPDKTSAVFQDGAAAAAAAAPRTFRYDQDFLIPPGPARRSSASIASAPLVFVRHGWVIPGKNINAYAGVGDIRGKILVVNAGSLPDGVRFDELRSLQAGADYDSPQTYGAKNGAVAIVRLPRSLAPDQWSGYRSGVARFGGGYRMNTGRPGRPQQERPQPALPEIAASPSLAEALFAGEARSAGDVLGQDAAAGAEGSSFPLASGKTLSLTITATTETATTQNVVAVLPGRDPVLKNEYVALGAHYDHVGVRAGTPPGQDGIFNGADDDGSGTVALLAIAEAAVRSGVRPRRSLLFVWHAGEEKGLWGSRHFTDAPTVPLDRIITQINIDMIGRSKKPGDTNPRNRELSGPDEIYVIGSKMMSTELGALSERVNRGYLNLQFNYKYDDPNDPNRFFFRSDHIHYARKNIPIIFFFDGVHEDYHGPGDEPQKIDYRKMERVTRTVLMSAWALANASKRPVVDKKLPPEFRGGGD